MEQIPSQSAAANNPRGHSWQLSDDGTVDFLAYAPNGHNGPICTTCGYYYCVHCHTDGPTTDCPGVKAPMAAPAEPTPLFGPLQMEGGYIATVERGQEFPDRPACQFFWSEKESDQRGEDIANRYRRLFLASPDLANAVHEFLEAHQAVKNATGALMDQGDAARLDAAFERQHFAVRKLVVVLAKAEGKDGAP